jgi:hypothetical protein
MNLGTLQELGTMSSLAGGCGFCGVQWVIFWAPAGSVAMCFHYIGQVEQSVP